MPDRSPRPRLNFREGDDIDVEHPEQLPFVHVRLLGHGHSGTVEEVKDITTGALFARKTIAIPAMRRARHERSHTFHNEVRTIRRLDQHRHVVRVFATYITSEHFGLILHPVADERDLSRFLQRYWGCVEEQSSTGRHDPHVQYMGSILKQAFGCLASGLVFMHESGIRHKDIKPHNILIHEGSVVYTDFGYSFDASQFSQSLSDGRGHLTRMYSAPEGLERQGRNQFSDVFSLGCVYLELLSALSGDPNLCPEGSDLTSQSERIFAARMGDIHEHLAQLDLSSTMSFLQDLIRSMTKVDRVDRSSAGEVLNRIVGRPEFSCAQCCHQAGYQPHDFVRWSWSEAHGDYYSGTYDEQGVSLRHRHFHHLRH